MIMACVLISWANIVLSCLILLCTVLSIILTRHSTRVNQKITLSNQRVIIYKLVQSLINSLQRALDNVLVTMPQSESDFAVQWNMELDKESVIMDLCKGANISGSSLCVIKEKIMSELRITKYIFFDKNSNSGIDSIEQLLEKYSPGNMSNMSDAAVNSAICQLASVSFTDNDKNEIKDSLAKARRSIASMEQEMTIGNSLNRG